MWCGGRSIEIGRDLKLDARLAVEVKPGDGEALVEATGNYVLTKSVVAAYRSGSERGRAYEIVSFSTGERGAFSKGTVCQPNGALERTVLDIMPPATQVAQRAQRTRPVATRRSTIVQTEIASDDLPRQPSASDDLGQQARVSDDPLRAPFRERRSLLDSLWIARSPTRRSAPCSRSPIPIGARTRSGASGSR